MTENNIIKEPDEIFCHSCGKAIKKEALICVYCGVGSSSGPVMMKSQLNLTKDKTTAVLLAVFLGYWTWLYTYKKDAWKFWVNLALAVPLAFLTLGFSIFASWLWAVIDVAVKPQSYYTNFPNE